MLTIVQRGGATREKPPEVARGFSSRLPWAWDGLCFAVPFNDSTRDAARDLVTNTAPSEWVGSPAWTKDDRGNNALLLDTSSYVGYANNPVHNTPSTAVTVYVRLRRAGAPTAPRGIFGKIYEDNVDPWTTWGIQTTDADVTQLAASVTVGGVNTYFENSSYTTDTSTWVSLFLRWTSGTTPVQDVLGERGQLLSTAPYGGTKSGTLSYPPTGQPIRLNTIASSGMWYAAYSQAMVWSRRLTDTELQALVADPYGWYSPRRTTVLISEYPLIFGGGEMHGGGGMGGLY